MQLSKSLQQNSHFKCSGFKSPRTIQSLNFYECFRFLYALFVCLFFLVSVMEPMTRFLSCKMITQSTGNQASCHRRGEGGGGRKIETSVQLPIDVSQQEVHSRWKHETGLTELSGEALFPLFPHFLFPISYRKCRVRPYPTRAHLYNTKKTNSFSGFLQSIFF